MTDINAALSQLIKNNLPEAVAMEMSKYLETSKNAIEENAALHKKNALLNRQISDLTSQVSSLSSKNSDLEFEIRRVNDLKRSLDHFQLELLKKEASIEARVSDASKHAAFDVINLFLKNQVIRTNIQKTVGIPVEGIPPSQYTSGTPGSIIQSYDSQFTTVENE